jgi:group I intron endonuclease
MMVIYKITNLLNGKIYVGQTVRSLKLRWRQHRSAFSDKMPISKAMFKYGKENFTIEQIDIANNLEELNKKEEHWISTLNSVDKDIGYNVRRGGKNSTLTDQTKEKIAQASLKKWKCDQFKQKMSQKKKQLWKNQEFRKKHRLAMQNIDKDAFVKKMSMVNKENATKRFSKPFNVFTAKLKSKGGWQKSAVYEKDKLVGTWSLKRDCAKDLQIHESGVSAALIKRTNIYKGYIFEYLGDV